MQELPPEAATPGVWPHGEVFDVADVPAGIWGDVGDDVAADLSAALGDEKRRRIEQPLEGVVRPGVIEARPLDAHHCEEVGALDQPDRRRVGCHTARSAAASLNVTSRTVARGIHDGVTPALVAHENGTRFYSWFTDGAA